MTTTSHEVSKKLKAFLGASAPEPVNREYFTPIMVKIFLGYGFQPEENLSPAYTLEDLLSKPFCEAISHKCGFGKSHADDTSEILAWKYFNGGFPAVEKELLRLMGEK